MNEKRISRLNELIKEEISKIILREMEFEPGILVTVTRAETAQDMRDANVFISVLPETEMQKIIDLLERKTGFLQGKINRILRMRPLPRLKFLPEKETVRAGHIEEILAQLKKEEK